MMPSRGRSIIVGACDGAAMLFGISIIWLIRELLLGRELNLFQQTLAIGGIPLLVFVVATLVQKRFSLKALMVCMAFTCAAWGLFLPGVRRSQQRDRVYTTLQRCGCDWDPWSELSHGVPVRVTVSRNRSIEDALQILATSGFRGQLVIRRELSSAERKLLGELTSLRKLELRLLDADAPSRLHFLRSLSELEELHIRFASRSLPDLDALPSLFTELRSMKKLTLGVQGNQHFGDDLAWINDLASLQSLTLIGLGSFDGLESINHPQLEVLELWRAFDIQFSSDSIKLQRLPRLRSLQVDRREVPLREREAFSGRRSSCIDGVASP